MRNHSLLAIIACVLLVALAGWADERILDFHSDIVIHADSSMTVTETIRVRAEGREIQHGIFRTFPTKYNGPNGEPYSVGFKVMAVQLRDGTRVPYFLKHQANGVVVYIGWKDRLLSSGEYTFVLTYETTRQIGFFESHDELYWNATGTDWRFPIEKASVTVTLPKTVDASAMPLEAYTGPQGARGRDYKAQVDNSGRAVFESTRLLEPGEGLTIVEGFPKGIVQKPSVLAHAMGDDLASKILLYGCVLVLLYYVAAWAWVGIDPRKGRILPRNTPPEGVSPAGMRLMMRMKFDQDVFRTAVVSMAVKGFLRIEHGDRSFFLVRDQADKEVLAPEELAIARILFASRHEFEIRQTDYAILQEAIKQCKTALRTTYEGVYYVVNGAYFVVGLVASMGLLAAASWLIERVDHEALFPTLLFAGWTAVLLLLCTASVTSVRTARKGRASSWGMAMAALLTTVVFAIGDVLVAAMLFRATSASVVGGIAGLEVLVFAFHYLLKAPTAKGRQLLDAIEGYRLWLTGGGQAALAIVGSPQESTSTFNAHMPFALALGIEEEWSQQFAGALARVGAREDSYRPYWYRDDREYGMWNMGTFTNDIGRAFHGAIASSSTPPGSSSGSSSSGFSSGGGGGGSSGGGGGGGGGGGW